MNPGNTPNCAAVNRTLFEQGDGGEDVAFYLSPSSEIECISRALREKTCFAINNEVTQNVFRKYKQKLN